MCYGVVIKELKSGQQWRGKSGEIYQKDLWTPMKILEVYVKIVGSVHY